MITTSRREKRYLRDQALRIGARRIVEVGCFKGATTRAFSEVVGDGGEVIAIDPMKWASSPASVGEYIDAWLHPNSYESAFWRSVNKSGFRNVRLIRKLSNDPTLLADPDPTLRDFDLLFIDAEHRYEAVRDDFLQWSPRVRAGGRILLHDCCSRFPGVERAVREIERAGGYTVEWPSRASGTIATLWAHPSNGV